MSLDQYALPGLVTMGGILQCVQNAKAVGAARGKYKVPVPETTGSPDFIRVFRAQQNNLEFFPVATGSLWVGSVFLHPVPSSLLYAGYLVGRAKFFKGYSESTEKRLPGFYLSIKFLQALLLLAFVGVGHKAVRQYTGFDVWQYIQDAVPALKFE